MVTSASSCRTGEIEGVGAVELVCVCRLSRMGGESLLLPVCRSVEVGSPAKGNRMLGWLGQLPDGQETSVGWEQDVLGWEVALPMVSVHSTCWMDVVWCWGVVGQRKLLDVVSGKRNVYKVSPRLG